MKFIPAEKASRGTLQRGKEVILIPVPYLIISVPGFHHHSHRVPDVQQTSSVKKRRKGYINKPKNLEYRYIIINPVLGILRNTLCNPSQIPHFLLLQLDKAVKPSKSELL